MPLLITEDVNVCLEFSLGFFDCWIWREISTSAGKAKHGSAEFLFISFSFSISQYHHLSVG